MILGVNFVVASLALIPFSILFKQYLKTQLLDFLIFALFFLTASLSMYSSVFAYTTSKLIFYQLHYSMWVLTYSILFFHAFRVKWGEPPKILLMIIGIWTLLLFMIISKWTKMEQPDEATVLFMTMPSSYSSYFPNGAGYMTSDGMIIFSTAHAILAYVFSLVSLAFTVYVYFTLDSVPLTKQMKKIKFLWLIALISSSIFYILGLPWLPHEKPIGVFLVIGIFILSYIAIFFPEGLLISDVQIIRARSLYGKIQTLSTTKKIDDFGMASLVNYLNQIDIEKIVKKNDKIDQ